MKKEKSNRTNSTKKNTTPKGKYYTTIKVDKSADELLKSMLNTSLKKKK